MFVKGSSQTVCIIFSTSSCHKFFDAWASHRLKLWMGRASQARELVSIDRYEGSHRLSRKSKLWITCMKARTSIYLSFNGWTNAGLFFLYPVFPKLQTVEKCSMIQWYQVSEVTTVPIESPPLLFSLNALNRESSTQTLVQLHHCHWLAQNFPIMF